MAEITHANQLRGGEFRKLIRKPKTWVWIIGVALVVGAIVGVFGSPVAGAITFVVVALVGVGVTFGIADGKAEEAFYDSYAKSRGLHRNPKPLGPATPLLRKGDKRRTDARFNGHLAPDIKGTLALWTYIVVTHDSKGNRQENPHPFTIVVIPMDEVAEQLSEMVVERTDGFGIFDKLEDKFRGNLDRLKLESEALDERFEIFVQEDEDPVFVRQLFSPSFIVWLTEFPTQDFAFEFGSGKLVAYIPKHRETSAEFDKMIADSCELARKLRAQVAT